MDDITNYEKSMIITALSYSLEDANEHLVLYDQLGLDDAMHETINVISDINNLIDKIKNELQDS